MVEKVARAICGPTHAAPWADTGKQSWEMFEVDARCAIEAHESALKEKGLVIVPREPTGGMSDAGVMTFGHEDRPSGQPYRAWRAMINAAPKGNEK